MKDIQVHLEKLRMQAAECETIRARPQIKRSGSFCELARDFEVLAADVERATNTTRHKRTGEIRAARLHKREQPRQGIWVADRRRCPSLAACCPNAAVEF